MSNVPTPTQEKQRMSMKIEGMHCASCVATIEKSLLNEDGVITATVSLLDEKAVIEYDSSLVDRSKLEKAVDSTGYRVKRAAMTMTIADAEYENDWRKITDSLTSQNGVITVNSFPDKRKLLIEYDEDILTFKIVKKVLRELGFEPDEAAG